MSSNRHIYWIFAFLVMIILVTVLTAVRDHAPRRGQVASDVPTEQRTFTYLVAHGAEAEKHLEGLFGEGWHVVQLAALPGAEPMVFLLLERPLRDAKPIVY